MISRRSLFGLALAPLMPAMPAPVKRSFLAPGHVVADPALLTEGDGIVWFEKLWRHWLNDPEGRVWCGCNRQERRNADCPCWQRTESNRPTAVAGAEKAGGP